MAKNSVGTGPTVTEPPARPVSRPTIGPMPRAEVSESSGLPEEKTAALPVAPVKKKTVTGKAKSTVPLKSGGKNG